MLCYIEMSYKIAHASGANFCFFFFISLMCFYAKCIACHILQTAEVFSFSEGIRGFVRFNMKSYLCEIFSKLKDEENVSIQLCACVFVCVYDCRCMCLICG